MMPTPAPAPAPSVRIDQWLWAARFAKTRSAAKALVEKGRVTVNGQPAKPSRAVRVGDAIRTLRGGEIYMLEVLDLGTQRGPASVAQTLYREPPESIAARAAARAAKLQMPSFTAPPARPDKRARRELLDLLAGSDY